MAAEQVATRQPLISRGDQADPAERVESPSAERALGTVGITKRGVDAGESRVASRAWWDADADDYHAEHGEFLGVADFVWCPERLREADAHLLGDVAGLSILEVGCGSAPCARWLAAQGARPVAFDISGGMLAHARRGNEVSGIDVPLVQASADQLPFADDSFDLACSAFGAIPFVADVGAVLGEVARVLRPGGKFVFAVTHPLRWIFPDDPGPDGSGRRTVLFRPDALRRGGRVRRGHVRGAPPHAR